MTDSKINQKDHTPQIRKNTEVELLQKKTLDESRRGETNMAMNREPSNTKETEESVSQQWGENWASINSIEVNVCPLEKLVPCLLHQLPN